MVIGKSSLALGNYHCTLNELFPLIYFGTIQIWSDIADIKHELSDFRVTQVNSTPYHIPLSIVAMLGLGGPGKTTTR